MNWYPQNKIELNIALKKYLIGEPKESINGIIVPHAGYEYSGAIAGKAFSLLKNKNSKKAIILGPSHYVRFRGIACLSYIKTPLGEAKIPKNNYQKLEYEHSVINQVPFLQKLGFINILPLVVGQINEIEAKKIAKELGKKDAIFVISSDLSHFEEYNKAKKIDLKTIEIIKSLDTKKVNEINACGIYPLLILMELCKIKNTKPILIEYKNSGDITGEKKSVVGYASFWF